MPAHKVSRNRLMGQVGVGIDGALWVSILVLWQILCAGLVLFVRFVVV